MDDLDQALAATTPAPESATSTTTLRKCRRHDWRIVYRKREDIGTYAEGFYHFHGDDGRPCARADCYESSQCRRCYAYRDDARSRRGRQSRSYGNRAELDVARTYGGTKVGHAGGPVDVRGKDFNTQVKTHRRPPPAEWTTVFAKLAASTDRLPRLLVRYVQTGGRPPVDYYVIPAKAWLDWYGKDDEDTA